MSVFPLLLASYDSQKISWPQAGNHILAQYDDHSIVVYQAYNLNIAKQLVEAQNFHADSVLKSGFNLNRMTWIKTNFLWMMFRSGWATKPNQERILAIRITRVGFEDILAKAVLSGRKTRENLGNPNKTDEVRLQWDPDHLPNGEKVESGRRAIQLGLRGKMISTFSKSYILNITDITDFVLEAHKNVLLGEESKLLIPKETVYKISDEEIVKKIQLSQ